MLRERGGREEFEQIFSTLAQHNKFCPPFFSGRFLGNAEDNFFFSMLLLPEKP
jgi:hypothetical protein